jgi:hypothetical protein
MLSAVRVAGRWHLTAVQKHVTVREIVKTAIMLRYEVLATVNVNNTVIWNMAPCILVD